MRGLDLSHAFFICVRFCKGGTSFSQAVIVKIIYYRKENDYEKINKKFDQ